MKVYLDNAASTPLLPEVIEIMTQSMHDIYANPSSVHEAGRKAKVLVEDCRSKIACLLNTSPGTIFFTSGGTESDNMAIKRSIFDYNIKHAITSPLSHHAVLYPLQELANKERIKLSYVNYNYKGLVDLKHLEDLLSNNPRTFVSIMHANNEIGTIQPIHEIGQICKNYDAIFHSDTVQTIGHYLFDLNSINLQLLSASAHKFHGPKGVGFLYINENLRITPFILGGSQERNMRAGTENIWAILGLTKAMEIAYANLAKDEEYIKSLKIYMIEALKKSIPDINFLGNCLDLENSLYTVLSVAFPKNNNSEMLLFNLDINGIFCSSGSACSSGTSKGSHVISAINPNPEQTVVRFSFSKLNTKKEIDYTINKLKDLFV